MTREALSGQDVMSAAIARDPRRILDAVRSGRSLDATASSAVFQAALGDPRWQDIFEEALPQMTPNLEIITPKMPGLKASPSWAAATLQTLVQAWAGDDMQASFLLAVHERNLPRIVLYLLCGLRPGDVPPDVCGPEIGNFLDRYATHHGRLALHRKAGPLAELLEAGMQDRVREIWPVLAPPDNAGEDRHGRA